MNKFIVSLSPHIHGTDTVVETGVTDCRISDLFHDARYSRSYLGDALRAARSFKVETRRADKRFPMTSIQLSQYVGGLLADAYWKFGRWQPYIGLTLGGGRTSSLLMFDGSSEDWVPETDVIVHNEAFFCINPNIGVEFALTPAVHLTFKTDWLVPLPTREMPSGPRFYLGVVFAH